MFAVVIGDAMLDTVVQAENIDLAMHRSYGAHFVDVRTQPGGNGVFFAEAALRAGFEQSTLLASIGGEGGNPDPAGTAIVDAVKRAGVEPRFSVCDGEVTGQAVLVYQPQDRRILFATRGANALVPEQAVEIFTSRRHYDVLYVSGYWLVNPAQRAATKSIIEEAENIGTTVVVDLAPHDLVELIGARQTLKIVELASCISTELETLCHLGGNQYAPRMLSEDVHAMVRRLLPSGSALVRLNQLSDFIWSTPGGFDTYRVDYIDGAASLRFTDDVLARQMYKSLGAV